ncbi:MAG: GYF domain-containing protein, partial [Flavisolibacter sp.]
MYQSFLLLRNNEQTGPYTLEQLLQLNLKPFDLVWEEGRSAAWRYPGEIDSLQACMMEGPELLCNSLHKEDLSKQESPVTSLPKKVFVSMPGRRPVQQAFAPPVDEPNLDTDAIIRQKAEELRLRVQNYAEQRPRQEYQPLMERQENNFSYFQKSTRKNKLSSRHLIILSGL